MTNFVTLHSGTSSGSAHFPSNSESPTLKTVPRGHPYSRGVPEMHTKYCLQTINSRVKKV